MTSDSYSNPQEPISHIEARIFKPFLEKYMENEVPTLPDAEKFYARQGAMKIVRSEDLGTTAARDRVDLREKIIELVEKYDPAPLLVKLNTTFDNTFVMDKRYTRRDPGAIRELVYYSWNELGKRIRKFYEEAVKDVDKEMQENLRQYGWTMGDYYGAIYAGMPANQITQDEIKENLKRLSSFEQDALNKITELQRASLERVDDALYREFGIRTRTNFSKSEKDEDLKNKNKRWLRGSYNTTAERRRKDEIMAGKLLHPISYLNRYCVEELGRIFRKESRQAHLIDPITYFRKFHPEMMSLSFADNNMLADNEDMKDYAL